MLFINLWNHHERHLKVQMILTSWNDFTSPSVKDADASVSPVVDLVVSKGGIAVRFYPNPCHGIVEDFVVLDDS